MSSSGWRTTKAEGWSTNAVERVIEAGKAANCPLAQDHSSTIEKASMSQFSRKLDASEVKQYTIHQRKIPATSNSGQEGLDQNAKLERLKRRHLKRHEQDLAGPAAQSHSFAPATSSERCHGLPESDRTGRHAPLCSSRSGSLEAVALQLESGAPHETKDGRYQSAGSSRSQCSSETSCRRGWSVQAMVRRFREGPPRSREVREVEEGTLPMEPIDSEAGADALDVQVQDTAADAFEQIASTSPLESLDDLLASAKRTLDTASLWDPLHWERQNNLLMTGCPPTPLPGSDILEWLSIGAHTLAEQHDDTACLVNDKIRTGLEDLIFERNHVGNVAATKEAWSWPPTSKHQGNSNSSLASKWTKTRNEDDRNKTSSRAHGSAATEGFSPGHLAEATETQLTDIWEGLLETKDPNERGNADVEGNGRELHQEGSPGCKELPSEDSIWQKGAGVEGTGVILGDDDLKILDDIDGKDSELIDALLRESSSVLLGIEPEPQPAHDGMEAQTRY